MGFSVTIALERRRETKNKANMAIKQVRGACTTISLENHADSNTFPINEGVHSTNFHERSALF